MGFLPAIFLGFQALRDQKSGRATGVQDLHFTSYILRCILRSISGTLQVYASGTLQEQFGKMTLGGVGLI